MKIESELEESLKVRIPAKKLLIFSLISSLLLLSMAGYSFALPYTDDGTSPVKFDVHYQLWPGPVLNPDYNVTETWIFDLDSTTAMTAADTITSAQLSIDFEPCTDCGTVTNPVKVDIFFDNYLALNDWSGSSGHPDDISAVDVLSYVLSDHNLNLTMRYPSAGFWVNGISLSGEYSPAVSITAFNNSVPVPEPANMIALGVFLLGMVAVSRKRFLTKK